MWSDENREDELARDGQCVLYVDTNPSHSASWGGRVNDGFHRGAHLHAQCIQCTSRIVLVAIAPADADEERYMEYGADYWQGHYDTLPPLAQADAAAHYDVTVIEGTYYIPAQRTAAQQAGRIHRSGSGWGKGPASIAPPRPRRARAPLPCFPRTRPLPPRPAPGPSGTPCQPSPPTLGEVRPKLRASPPPPVNTHSQFSIPAADWDPGDVEDDWVPCEAEGQSIHISFLEVLLVLKEM